VRLFGKSEYDKLLEISARQLAQSARQAQETERQLQISKAQQAETERQLELTKRQQDQAEKQQREAAELMGRSRQHQERYAKLLDTWEELPPGKYGVKPPRLPPPQFAGITLSAERAGDDTGIAIRLPPVLRKGSPSGRVGRQGGWETSERVAAGRKVLLASSGASAYDYRLNASACEDLAQALHTALSRPPDEPLEVLVTISRQE